MERPRGSDKHTAIHRDRTARDALDDAIWTKKTTKKLDERIRILHPKWEPAPGKGPIELWKKEWIDSLGGVPM